MAINISASCIRKLLMLEMEEDTDTNLICQKPYVIASTDYYFQCQYNQQYLPPILGWYTKSTKHLKHTLKLRYLGR